MGFNLSSDVRTYFRQINEKSSTGEFDSLWDQYYLAAMLGMKERRRIPENESPSNEFHTEVIEDYSDQRYEIYSALIVAEIDREGVPMDNKQEVRELMLEILDSTSHTNLTSFGETLLDCYAESGARTLRSEIPSPPDLDEFLRNYHDLLSSV